MFDNRKEFIVAAALENFYCELLEAQTFSCEDAISLSRLRRMAPSEFKKYIHRLLFLFHVLKRGLLNVM